MESIGPPYGEPFGNFFFSPLRDVEPAPTRPYRASRANRAATAALVFCNGSDDIKALLSSP
jgi:hypothetical protein